MRSSDCIVGYEHGGVEHWYGKLRSVCVRQKMGGEAVVYVRKKREKQNIIREMKGKQRK